MGGYRVKLVIAHLIAFAIFFLAPILALGQPMRLPGDSLGIQLREDGQRVGEARSLDVLGAAVECVGSSCSLDARRGRVVDVRRYGAKCDGTTDDASAFRAAYDQIKDEGGGTIYVPESVTCRIGSDVIFRDKVSLRCGVGSLIKATDAATFTFGMFTATQTSPLQLAASDMEVAGCTFDLNGKKGPALSPNGENITVKNNYVTNGSSSEANNHTLLSYGCSGASPVILTSTCEIANNRVECAGTSGAKDIGISIQGSLDNGQFLVASNNEVVGCDIYGIRSAAAATIRDNGVTVIGSTAIGIESSGPQSSIASNRIVASGASSVGIKTTSTGLGNSGSFTSVRDNKISAAGAFGYGIYVNAGYNILEGNMITLDASPAGPDETVGIYAGGLATRIVGNVIIGDPGEPTNETETTHVLIGNQHTTIVGNFFSGGLYGIVPDLSASSSINTTIANNQIMGMDDTGTFVTTGWSVEGNYIAWMGSGACSVRVGYDLTEKVTTTSHSRINHNRLHSAGAGARGICFTELPATVCNSGSRAQMACNADNLTECPGATNDCSGPNADCCNGTGTTTSGLTIVGNECLFVGAGQGPCVDFASGISSSSGTITNVTVVGNTCVQNALNTCIGFPTTNTDKITKIRLGLNGTDNGTLYANFLSSMGSIDSGQTFALQLNASSGCGVATAYMGIAGCTTTEANVTWSVPTAITVTGFKCSQPSDNTCTMRWTLRKNGADQTDIQCTATNVAMCSDTGSVSYTGGDSLSIKVEDMSPSNCGDNLGVSCILDYTQ